MCSIETHFLSYKPDVAPLVVMERGARVATGIIAEASFGGQGRRHRLRHGAAG